MKYLLVAVYMLLALSSQGWAQDDGLDFSELDKVEKDEFGENKKPGDDNADFDLDNPSQPPGQQGNLEDELDLLDEEGKQPAQPGSDTVDLDKELDEGVEQGAGQPQTPEEPPQQAEELPQLETPPPQEAQEPPPPEEPPQMEVKVEPPPASPDEPDAKLEARINRIYAKFLNQKTTDEEWLQIAGEKASETYTVQKGDTLWDISVTFFGNGFFWPKLWQLNDDITNPHEITPGKVLKFQAGSLTQAPQMDVMNEAPPAEPEAPVQVPTEVAAAQPPPEAPAESKPEIPPAKPTRPALKKIPPSLPALVFDDEGEYDQEGFSLEKEKPGISEPEIPLATYISEEKPTGIGEIVGVEENGAERAGTWQYVYINLPGGKPGEVVTAISLVDSVQHKRTKFGYQVDYLGTLQVISRVDDEKPIFKALVTGALSLVNKGALLIREPIAKLTMDKSGRSSPVQGEIVGGNFDKERKFLGQTNIVFLDVGADQGLSPGDIVTVMKKETERDPDSLVKKPVKAIGSIKIAKTTPSRSTGVILESIEAIVPGDAVGSSSVSQTLMNEEQSAPPAGESGSEDDLDL